MNDILFKFNFALYQSFQSFSILINNFVCLETILNIRNPISPVRIRLKLYFFLTILISTVSFIFNFFFCLSYDNITDITDIRDFLFLKKNKILR